MGSYAEHGKDIREATGLLVQEDKLADLARSLPSPPRHTLPLTVLSGAPDTPPPAREPASGPLIYTCNGEKALEYPRKLAWFFIVKSTNQRAARGEFARLEGWRSLWLSARLRRGHYWIALESRNANFYHLKGFRRTGDWSASKRYGVG